MHKRGLFLGKKGLNEVLIIGEAVAGIIVIFILFEVARYYGSGDIVRSQFLAKDVALTVDGLSAASYPTSSLYQAKGFAFTKKLKITNEEIIVAQNLIENSFPFVPDKSISVSEHEFDIAANTVNAFQLGRSPDSITADIVVPLSQKRICPGSVLPIEKPKIAVVTDESQRGLINGFFSAIQDLKVVSDLNEINNFKPDFIIMLKQTKEADYSAILSFKSEDPSDSRRMACLITNALMDKVKKPIPINPGFDDTLDSDTVSKYAAVLINYPEKSEQPLTESISSAISKLSGK